MCIQNQKKTLNITQKNYDDNFTTKFNLIFRLKAAKTCKVSYNIQQIEKYKLNYKQYFWNVAHV